MKKNCKILKFEAKEKELMTNDEIMKVFLGLIRLVQKSAEYTAFEKVQTKLNYYEKRLNEVTIELNKKNKQLDEILKLNDDLISEINKK